MEISTFKVGRTLLICGVLSVFMVLSNQEVSAQIPVEYQVDINYTPEQLVQEVLIGGGIQTSNIVLSKGANISRGKFSGTSNIGIESGVILSSGDARKSKGPNNSPSAGQNNGTAGDADLNQLASGNTNDACVLEFDFVPESNTVEFRYVFASEEYPEYVGSINDVFGFFISGPGIYGPFSNNSQNIAYIPGVLPPAIVSINTVNHQTNSQFYVNNGGGQTIQYDGFTTVLTARAVVQPCQTYHIKLAIADMVDFIYDSGVFLEANSFTSVGLGANIGFTHMEVDTAVEGCNSANVTFKLFQITPVDYPINLTIGGTAENGVDYVSIPETLIIPQGQDSVILTIDPIEDMPEDYTETVTLVYNSSMCGTVLDTIVMYIKDLQPFSSAASSGQDILCGDTIVLEAAGDGGQVPYYYLWSTGETTPSITVSPPNPIQYTVQIYDICEQADTLTIDINVIGPTAEACDDFNICLNKPAVLSVTGGTSWKWTATPPDASLTPDIDTLQNITVYPLVSTTYTVTVFDECGNFDIDVVEIAVGQPYANAGNDTTICTGDTYLLKANFTPNGVYIWREGAGTSGPVIGNTMQLPVTPTATTTYTVSVTDECGNTRDDQVTITVTDMTVTANVDLDNVCVGTMVELTATSSLGGSTFIWRDDSGAEVGTGAIINVTPAVTTTYTVAVTGACVKDGPPVTVTVNPLPLVDATAVLSSICPDESVTLNAGGAVSYVWTAEPADPSLAGQTTSLNPDVSPAVNTIYTLTGTDANGCVNTDQTSITVKPRMFADFTTPGAVCEGDAITLTYTGNGAPAATYDWTFDGGIKTGGSNHEPSVQWSTMGTKTITLVVTQNLCVSEPFTQTVNVNQTPVVNFTSGITSGCVPLTVDFENTSTNTATGVNYLWDFGAAGTSTIRSVSHEFTQPGTYDVTLRVTNPGNCVTTKNVPVMVEVWPRPVAAFTADPMKVSLKNPVINFTSTSTGTDLSYVWNTGDGNTYTLPSFTHTYVDSGLFTVEMTVKNGLGCDNMFSEIINITPKYMLKVPTAFSPNGDGMNDHFRIIGNGVKKFRISIYNRWGTLVFTTEDINNSWDGLVNGQPAQPGPYVYHTYFMDDNDEVSEQSGSFVLMK